LLLIAAGLGCALLLRTVGEPWLGGQKRQYLGSVYLIFALLAGRERWARGAGAPRHNPLGDLALFGGEGERADPGAGKSE